MTNDAIETTVASVLANSMRPVRSQLELAASQTTGTALASINSALALTEQTETLVIEQYNSEVDDFNALVDRCESAESRNSVLALDIADAQSKQADREIEAAEANATTETAKAQIAVLQAEKRQLKLENERLLSMNPERQKNQITSLKQTIADKATLLDQQKEEIRKIRKEQALTKNNLALMIQQNAELTSEIDELRARLQRIDGDVEPVWYPAVDNSGLQFYFYTFGWRLTLGSPDRDLHIDLLQDIDWHIEVRTNSGISVLVSVTQWCRARYPILEQFKNAWPGELGQALNRRIAELLEDTHPQLVHRAEWAQSVHLSSLPLNDKWLDLLSASSIHSLYTVVSHTPEELSNLVKGFGIATARQVHAACMNTVKDWQSENQNSGIAA